MRFCSSSWVSATGLAKPVWHMCAICLSPPQNGNCLARKDAKVFAFTQHFPKLLQLELVRVHFIIRQQQTDCLRASIPSKLQRSSGNGADQFLAHRALDKRLRCFKNCPTETYWKSLVLDCCCRCTWSECSKLFSTASVTGTLYVEKSALSHKCMYVWHK